MDTKKTLTIIGFVALLITVPIATGILQNQDFELRISALQSDEPTKVLVSDLKGSSFRVSWITERPVLGAVELADGTQFFEEEKVSFHSVRVNGLDENTVYDYSLLSDSKKFSDPTWPEAQTAVVRESESNYLVYGQVFSPDGYSFQQEGLITLQLEKGPDKSQILSTKLNETGGYQFDIAGILNNARTEKFDFEEDVNVYLTVYVSHEMEPIEKIYPVNFTQTRQIPNMYLGEVNIDVIPAIDGTE